MKEHNIILASSSLRRKDLMLEAKFEFEVRIPASEELSQGDPIDIVIQNAITKARSVEAANGDLIVGADTIVLCNEEILGKPADREDAKRMIMLQIEHPQRVITGVCVMKVGSEKVVSGYEVSGVRMIGSDDDVKAHIESRQWMGKAGAFGIQDEGSLSFQILFGERDNIVGLPMTLLKRLLSLVGFKYPDRTPAIE
jgi:nucleoside triphosphate pyrophosphatase